MSSRAAAPPATTQSPASPPATSAPGSPSPPVVYSTSRPPTTPPTISTTSTITSPRSSSTNSRVTTSTTSPSYDQSATPQQSQPLPHTTTAQPSTTTNNVVTSTGDQVTPSSGAPPITSTLTSAFSSEVISTDADGSTIIIVPTSVTGSKSSNPVAIVGGVAGGIAVLAIAIIIFFFCWRRNRRREKFDAPSTALSASPTFTTDDSMRQHRNSQALLGSTYEGAAGGTGTSAPMIREVPIGNASYMGVVNQFTKQWKHPTQKPTVIKLWRIYADQSVFDRFSRYQLEVERRTGLERGNTRRRFHGTIRECTLGDTSSDDNLCMQTRCNMCRIIESSFQLARAGERTNFGRFGAGIYTSATSSKANDYFGGSASPNRAMLLNDVVMGKAIKLRTTNQSLKQPPRGYDAVIGEPGGDLNYDESVVYNNAAIRPSFLIVYNWS